MQDSHLCLQTDPATSGRSRTRPATKLCLGRLTARPTPRHTVAMTARKKKRTRRKPSGQLIDVARVIAVGQDRDTQEALLQLRDTEGKLIAIRLKPQQFGTASNGSTGAREGAGPRRGRVTRHSTRRETTPPAGLRWGQESRRFS